MPSGENRPGPSEFLTDIALVISDLRGGGAQRVAVTMAKAWSAAGLRVGVITQSSPDSDAFTLDPTIPRISLGGSGNALSMAAGLVANVRRVLAIRGALKQLRPACVLSFMMQPNVLTVLATRGFHGRVVVSERNDPARQRFSRVWEFLRRKLYHHADLVTANSQGALETMKSYVPEDKLALLPNPTQVSMSSLDSAPSARTERRTILAVGRLNHQKGYDVLLEAFARFRQATPDAKNWRLIVLGEGPLGEELLRQCQGRQLEGFVDWKGYVSDPYPYYRTADIFALASRYEGSPNALLEAMSCGVPAIVTDASPGPLELIEDGIGGLVVPAEDPAALAAALARLAADETLRQRMGSAARDRAAENALSRVLPIWNRALALHPAT